MSTKADGDAATENLPLTPQDAAKLKDGIAVLEKQIAELRAENERLRAKIAGGHNEH